MDLCKLEMVAHGSQELPKITLNLLQVLISANVKSLNQGQDWMHMMGGWWSPPFKGLPIPLSRKRKIRRSSKSTMPSSTVEKKKKKESKSKSNPKEELEKNKIQKLQKESEFRVQKESEFRVLERQHEAVYPSKKGPHYKKLAQVAAPHIGAFNSLFDSSAGMTIIAIAQI